MEVGGINPIWNKRARIARASSDCIKQTSAPSFIVGGTLGEDILDRRLLTSLRVGLIRVNGVLPEIMQLGFQRDLA